MKYKKLTDKQFGTLVKIFVVLALAYFLSSIALAEPIKVAVLDTGYDFRSKWVDSKLLKPKLCKEGHKSFIGDIQDTHGHGTHVAGLIAQGNKNIDYCLVILKVFQPGNKNYDPKETTSQALKYAVDLGVDIINYSGGGTTKDEIECALIEYALGNGIKVIAAAGNEHSSLNNKPYYPAMCNDSIYKITAKTAKNSRLPASNYTDGGIPRVYGELGENVTSLLPNDRTGMMSGTSQATAIATSKMVRQLYTNKILDAIKRSKVG